MVWLIISSVLIVGIAGVILIALVIAWALSSPDAQDDRKVAGRSRKRGSLFARLWRWANTEKPKLDYRRDSKGRFRKMKRW